MTQAKQWRRSRSTPALLELPGGGTHHPRSLSHVTDPSLPFANAQDTHPSACSLPPATFWSETPATLVAVCPPGVRGSVPTAWPSHKPCRPCMSCPLPQPPLLQISKNILNSRFKFHLREASRTAQSKTAAPPCPSLSQQPYFITSLACLTLWPYCLYCFSAFYPSPSLRGELIRMGSLSCALLPSQSLKSCLGC